MVKDKKKDVSLLGKKKKNKQIRKKGLGEEKIYK
jgi:hypothetical protein